MVTIMISELLINTILQLILFSIIPVLWWFFSARKKEPLFSWLGLTVPKFVSSSKAILVFLLSLGPLLALGIYLILSFEDRSVLAQAKFAQLGIGGIVPILIYAVFQTGLSEEIFFRGFLNKRLSNKFGFAIGNTVQAVLFGSVHGLLLFGSLQISLILLIVAFTAATGWLMGFLNEKLSGGSIIPSWTIHSLANIIPAVLIAFGVIAV